MNVPSAGSHGSMNTISSENAAYLAGNIHDVHPEPWGNDDPIWRAYFSDGFKLNYQLDMVNMNPLTFIDES